MQRLDFLHELPHEGMVSMEQWMIPYFVGGLIGAFIACTTVAISKKILSPFVAFFVFSIVWYVVCFLILKMLMGINNYLVP